MYTHSSIINMGLNISNQDKADTGFLLSMDEIELVKNMGRSLESAVDREFLNRIAEKEFITTEEKDLMQQIFTKAAKRITEEVSLSV